MLMLVLDKSEVIMFRDECIIVLVISSFSLTLQVYDGSQIRMQYLHHMDFEYN